MNYYNNYFGTYIKFFFTLFFLFIYPINSNSHPEDYKKFKFIKMEVLRDGNLIGFSNYQFRVKDNILEVENETKFEVKVLGIKLFSINSKGIERYNKNKLISYNSETLQNDKKKFANVELSENKKEYEIIGSSFKGYGSLKNVIGNWWNHDILETDSQISPLSGSIKQQIVKFVDKENIIINNKNYLTDHYKIISKDPNTPEDKKLNFDIWYNKQENLILRIVYNKMGYWEYNVVNFEKN